MSQSGSSGTEGAVGCVAGAELAGTAPTATLHLREGVRQGWVVQGGHTLLWPQAAGVSCQCGSVIAASQVGKAAPETLAWVGD